MAFDAKAVANQLETLLDGLSGMNDAQIGVPESTGPRVSAYVTIGSGTLSRKTAGTMQRDQRYFVTFAYRVDGNESTAETTLMDLVDAFLGAIFADLTLAGTCEGVEIDSGLADDPEYQMRAGKEFREYPVLVIARQYGGYAVNP